MTEPFRLSGDALRHFLHVAGDVGELDAEAADAVGELVDQAFAFGGRSCDVLLGRQRRHSL